MLKPVTQYRKPAEAADDLNLQPVALTGEEGLSFIDSTAAVPSPGLLDSPQSVPNETDREQIRDTSPEAERLRSPNAKDADEENVSMTFPKVVLTYTKKAKRISTQRNASSAMFLTQSYPHTESSLDGLLDYGVDAPIEQLAPNETPKTKPAKKPTSAASQKRKRQPLQEVEKDHRVDLSENDADIVVVEKRKKIKRRKRRAPVNELALVTTIPSHEDSPTKAQVRTSFEKSRE